MHRRLLALALLSTSLSLPAQLPPGALTPALAENTILWPNVGSGPLRRIQGAFVYGVTHRSAVGLRGPAAAIAVAPSVTPYATGMDLGAPVIDCVTLPGAGLADTGGQHRDALLFSVVGDDELLFVCTDAAGVLVKPPVSHPTFDRASMLNAFPDPTGITVAGRSLSGTSVVLTRFDRATRTFTELAPIPIGALVRDLCVYDENDDGVPDIAVVTDTQVQFHNLLGGPPSTRPLLHPGGAVEWLPEPGHRGGLALLQRNATNNGWELIRILDGDGDAPVAVEIDGVANFALTAVTSGDVTGDGYFDVVIQNGLNSALLARNNPAAAPRFADASSGPLLTVGGPGDVQGPAAVYDSDYDGVHDVVAPGSTPFGVPFLSLHTGTRAVYAPLMVQGDVLGTCEHGGELGTHTFRLQMLLSDYLKGFPLITVTYYSAEEAMGLGTTSFAVKVDGDQYTIPPEYEEVQYNADIELEDTDWIDRPNLLFVMIQFSDPNNFAEKPTFLAGATIDDSMQTQASSPWLAANQIPQSEPKIIERQLEGRQFIGLITPMRSLPAHID